MIRRCPSIVTTGSVGSLQHAEVRERIELAGEAKLLEALVLAGLGEDVDRGRHERQGHPTASYR